MQKWIRDRMRRRKKKTPGDSGAATQASPLQPIYPEEQQPSDELPDATTALSATTVDEPVAVPTSTAEHAEETPPAPRSRRRRKKKPAPVAEQAPLAAEPASEQPEFSSTEEDDSARSTAAPVVETAQPPVAPEQPSAPAVEPAPDSPRKPQRASKGAVVLAVGLPGSGKSTWYKRRGVTPLSSDAVRQLLFDDPAVQHHQDLVFGTLRSLLRARLIARMPMNYVDATNLSPKERRHWIKMARDFGYEVQAVYFDVPLEVCIERNRRRNRVVPDDVMHRMAAKLKPPTFDEGFSKIIVVRVKQRAPESANAPEPHAGEQDRAVETE